MVMAIMRMTAIIETEIIDPKDETYIYTYLFILKSRQIEHTKVKKQTTKLTTQKYGKPLVAETLRRRSIGT
jgi:hypothetical protein